MNVKNVLETLINEDRIQWAEFLVLAKELYGSNGIIQRRSSRSRSNGGTVTSHLELHAEEPNPEPVMQSLAVDLRQGETIAEALRRFQGAAESVANEIRSNPFSIYV